MYAFLNISLITEACNVNFSYSGAAMKVTLPIWTIAAPIIAWALYFAPGQSLGVIYLALLTVALFGGVLAAVHHAEVVAHRVGEPYGTLVLAVAITIIEVALIVSLMMAGGPETTALARDTIFAAVMIILNGIVGICLLAGGAKYKEQTFSLSGASAALTTLAAIAVLTLILPNYTTSAAGPFYTSGQLIFISVVTLVLYGTFVLVQTVRHRDYFLPSHGESDEEVHAAPPSLVETSISSALLLVCLVAVVLLAKALAPSIELGVATMGAPKAVVGVIIAGVVLLPEGLAALRAARANRLQTSLNLALGSAIASIGLTIPAVAVVALVSGSTLTLGIDIKSTVLLLLSLFTTMLALATGKTTVLPGVVLLVIFAVYLFVTVIP
jgi:Ca2+:H+ antiporter